MNPENMVSYLEASINENYICMPNTQAILQLILFLNISLYNFETNRHGLESTMGPSINYVTLKFEFFDPLPPYRNKT